MKEDFAKGIGGLIAMTLLIWYVISLDLGNPQPQEDLCQRKGIYCKPVAPKLGDCQFYETGVALEECENALLQLTK